jgi:two-component system NtrC family sensor kinase
MNSDKTPSGKIFSKFSALGCCLTLAGCRPVEATMDARSLAWVLLLLAIIIVAQFAVIALLLARHPRMRRHLVRWGLIEPQRLAKTRHQLYREIARHEATEELLRETQEYLQCVINSIPSVLIGITPDGYVTHWNSAAEKASGLPANEVLGAHIQQAYPGLPVDMETIARIMKMGSPNTRKNVRRGEGIEGSYTDVTICPLISEEISGAVVLADDVTLRVRFENMMIQNEKMTSLGELAAGLAHEINNPLAGILNNVQNILRRTSGDLAANRQLAAALGVDFVCIQEYLKKRQIPEFAENIREAGERATHIVRNMLEFSHSNGHLEQSKTDLVELVKHSLELAVNTFEIRTRSGTEQPSIDQHFAPNLPPIVCSPSEIQQVILNLLRNAAQSFQKDEYGPQPKIGVSVWRDEQQLCIEISDNGPGMTEEVARHVFEPFFTTKGIGQGTGLGLSVSHFIITEHHQGTITVDTQPGQGTRFLIRLPIGPQHAGISIGGDSRHSDRSED